MHILLSSYSRGAHFASGSFTRRGFLSSVPSSFVVDLSDVVHLFYQRLISGSIFSGCGYNISNSNPTICVNDLIHRYNSANNTKLAEISIEQSIARTVTVMEELISQFQKDGYESFCKAYYKRWLHR